MKKVFEKLGVTLEHKMVGNMSVWHFNKPRAPFSVYLQYATGALDDAIAGTTHFLEHMLVSGTKTFPTKKALADYSVEKGWGTNAYTSRLALSFPIWANTTADIKPALTLLDEYIHHSIFDPKTIEKERTAIFDEIQRASSDTDRIIFEKSMEFLYPHTALTRSVLGTKESVASITRDELLKTAEKVKLFPRALISIGDCGIDEIIKEIPDQLVQDGVQEITRTFLDLKIGSYTTTISNLKGAQVDVYYPAKSFGDRKKEVACSFIRHLLFATNGLLINKLRYEKGLTYHVDGIGLTTPYYECAGISVTCNKEKIDEVLRETTTIVEKDLCEKITDIERQKYLERREIRLFKDWESATDWLESYDFDFLYLKDKTVFHDEWREILMSLSIEEIKIIAREIFKPETRTTITFLGEDK